MKSLFTFICIVSSPFLSAQEVKTVEKSAQQVKAESHYKERNYEEAIALLEKLIPTVKPSTPAEVQNKYGLMATHAFAYSNLKKKDEYLRLMKQRYEYITKESMRFPDDVNLVILRLNDMNFLAGSINILKENEKRLALNLQAVAIADDLVTKHPEHEGAKISKFRAYTNLAKSYRWNKELRGKAPAVVDKGLAVLETIKKFPDYSSKAFMTLQIQALKVSVLSLSKDYKKALEASSDLVEKTKPMLSNPKASKYQLSELFGTLYQHAFLYEKLGKSEEAQNQLQHLLNTIDACLEKNPKDKLYLNAKARYSKLKGKKLR